MSQHWWEQPCPDGIRELGDQLSARHLPWFVIPSILHPRSPRVTLGLLRSGTEHKQEMFGDDPSLLISVQQVP